MLLISVSLPRPLASDNNKGFPGGSDGKKKKKKHKIACNVGDLSSIWEDPLEKGMATHSSILAWKTPWTEEPGGLLSMGSQRVGHDWATNHTLCLYGVACSGHSMKGNHIICGLLWLTFLSLFSGFSYAVVRISTIIFFFLAELYSIVWRDLILFIRSSVNRYLGCFRVLAVRNNASMNVSI